MHEQPIQHALDLHPTQSLSLPAHPDARDGAAEAPPTIIEAIVQTGGLCTRYRRAGCGQTVLLLVGAARRDARERLLVALAPSFRVVAPEPPRSCLPNGRDGDDTGPAAWLRDLVEGLGVERPVLVADEAMAAAALAFVLEDPERAGPLVVIGVVP